MITHEITNASGTWFVHQSCHCNWCGTFAQTAISEALLQRTDSATIKVLHQNGIPATVEAERFGGNK